MTKRRASGDGMVRKRSDGRWEGRIVVGHKENGKPIFRYLSAKTQKELLEKLRTEKEKYLGVEITEQSKMLLHEWLDHWLTEYALLSVRESTLNGYRGYIERYIKPYLGNKPVGKITDDDVRELYRKVQIEGLRKPLSPSSIRKMHGMFHQAMNAAMQEHLIAANPTEGIVLPQKQPTVMRVLNDEQLDIFMATIEQDDIWHDFFYTELTTGLRLREICGLKWCDFNETKGTLKVTRTLHYRRASEYTTGETKTGKGKRTITLPPSTADILRSRKAAALTEWIFPNPTRLELPTAPHAAYGRLKAILKKSGLPDIRFHDLRHTFATMALEHGMNIKTLSTIIGHASGSTTLNIYAHITDEMLQKAAVCIDKGIIGAEIPETPEMPKGTTERTDFTPYRPPRRRPGTGCVSQINDHLWEGKYSPIWPDGKKHSRNVYAKTSEECEEKLKVLIVQMKRELADLKAAQVAGMLSRY